MRNSRKTSAGVVGSSLYRGGNSYVPQVGKGRPAFQPPGLMDFGHYGIPLCVVSQCPLGAKKPVSRRTGLGEHSHVNLNLLAIGHAQSLFQLNRIAMHHAIGRNSRFRGLEFQPVSCIIEESRVRVAPARPRSKWYRSTTGLRVQGGFSLWQKSAAPAYPQDCVPRR